MTTLIVQPSKDYPPPGSHDALSRGCICQRTLVRDGRWRVRQDCAVHGGMPRGDIRKTQQPTLGRDL